MTPKFQKMLDRMAAPVLDRQEDLETILEGDPQWDLDLDKGELTIGGNDAGTKKRFTFPAQALGAESADGKTWTWAWAEKRDPFPKKLLEVADIVRDWGIKMSVPELTLSKVELEGIDSYCLAAVAGGLTNANFFFRAPREEGALFLLLKDSDFSRKVGDPLQRISIFFPAFLLTKRVPIEDQRVAFREYLTYYGMEVVENDIGEEKTVLGKLANRGQILGTFNTQGKLKGSLLLSTAEWPE